jgi:hypothetical protein
MPDADAVYIPEVEGTYADWLRQHPSGYVINAPKSGTQPMMWHRADCEHIQPFENTHLVEGDWLKACSLNPGALAVWAMTHGRELHYCKDCRDMWLKEQRST